MTLREKVGQMTQINLPVLLERTDDNVVRRPIALDPEVLTMALDSFRIGSVMNTADQALSLDTWRRITETLHEESKKRVGIPILFGIDAIHGANYTLRSTLLPHQLMMAASFNDSLAEAAARITAYETKASGIPWVFSPILDVARNPFWVQFFETFGEDTYLTQRMGKAMVEGYQMGEGSKAKVLACAKHFVGVGAVRTGRDRTPIDMGERKLRDVFLPPFETAIEADVASIMIATNEIDGIPTHANPYLLKDVLRDELGFDGVLISDWGDVQNLYTLHKVVASMEEAVKLAVESGIDVVMVPNDFQFSEILYQLVKRGEVSESRLDSSVYRILKAKQSIGLLDDSFLQEGKSLSDFGKEEHYKAAYEMALEGACLLKNDNALLPLSGAERVLICGNAADDLRIQNGAWSRTWQGRDTLIQNEPHATLHKALSDRLDLLVFADRNKTSAWLNGSELDMLDEADVAIVCIGERPATEKPGDVETIALPEEDQALIELLKRKGKSIVLVLIQSRPRIVRQVEPLVDAIMMGFVPGNSGGEAIADLILGHASPSGKLPFSYPRYEGVYMPYSHKHIEAMDTNYGMTAFRPQWAFGTGLGYSEVAYESIRLSHDTLDASDTLTVQVVVHNRGDQFQKDAVLVFVSDQVARVTPEVRRLVAYEKIALNADQKKTVQLRIPIAQLKRAGVDPRNRLVEPGWFELSVGKVSRKFFVASD
jgi:beta-glucosidase